MLSFRQLDPERPDIQWQQSVSVFR